MNILVKTTIALAAATVPFGAAAQDLSTEIDVERTVTPEHRAAAPLSTVTPRAALTAGRPVLELAEFSLTDAGNPSPGAFGADGADGLPEVSPYRGYAAIGYFPALNISGAAGYRFIDSDTTRLAAAVRYEGASWHALHRPDGSKGNAAHHTFGINAAASHLLGKVRLNVDGDYFHTAATTPLPVDKYSRSIDGAAITARIGADGRLSWYARAHYIYTGVSKAPDGGDSPSENRYGLTAGTDYKISRRFSAFIHADIDGFSRSGREWLADGTGTLHLTDIARGSGAVISVVPGVGYSGTAFHARAAVRVNIGTGTGNSAVHVAPAVHLTWMPAPRFAIYAEALGGEKVAGMRGMYDYSPLAMGLNSFGTTLTNIDARAGIRIGSLRGLSVGVEGRYAHTDGAPMLATTSAGTAFAPFDICGWRAKAYVRYGAPFADAFIKATAEKLAHGARHAFVADPDRPEWIVDVRIGAAPLKALSLEARWQWRADRCCYSLTGDSRTDLGDVNNLSLQAVYNISSRLSCGITLENLLCRRYQIIAGVRSQGIHGLAGVQYKF